MVLEHFIISTHIVQSCLYTLHRLRPSQWLHASTRAMPWTTFGTATSLTWPTTPLPQASTPEAAMLTMSWCQRWAYLLPAVGRGAAIGVVDVVREPS
jgi:hypothetical protein